MEDSAGGRRGPWARSLIGRKQDNAAVELHHKGQRPEDGDRGHGPAVAKGPTEVSIVYDDNQQPAGLKWTVQSPRLGRVGFALPCNINAEFAKLTEQRITVTAPESRRQQAIRTFWRILKDWVEAQMALLENGMVTMDETFLPYMLAGGQNLYQTLAYGEFRALNPPRD